MPEEKSYITEKMNCLLSSQINQNNYSHIDLENTAIALSCGSFVGAFYCQIYP